MDHCNKYLFCFSFLGGAYWLEIISAPREGLLFLIGTNSFMISDDYAKPFKTNYLANNPLEKWQPRTQAASMTARSDSEESRDDFRN